MNKLLVILLFSVAIPQISFAQFTYVVDQSIPVELNGESLSMPWGGGINSAQFNTMDLNGDGIEDIVVFDRTTDKVVTYVWENEELHYKPEYEVFFPSEVTNWMLLRDFNCDGKKDLFTSDPLGIRVFENTTVPGQEPSWKPFLFYSPVSKQKVRILLTTGFSGKTNLQLSYDDLPSISDADGDGDLDIFCPKYPGGTTFEYHQNMSIENYGTCDSLDFTRVTQEWAGVNECICGNFGFGEPCPPSITGREQHVSGKAFLAFDPDGDGDTDMVFSEDNCAQLFLLNNTGDNTVPVIASASTFPSPNPAFIIQYPAVYFEDGDMDGIKDLVISPNFAARVYLASNLRSSVWFYKNTGTNQSPSFNFERTNLLQKDMIDVGDNAVPAFFDADADGDFDMFVGYFTRSYSSSIYYYENVGTAAEPSFKFITDDFAGLSFSNIFNIKPAFVDLNGDTKVDLAFTGTDLNTGVTSIYHALNTNGIGLNFENQPHVLPVSGLNLAQSESICFVDVDSDGRPDMLVGRADGALEYWRNTGTGLANFVLEESEFLGLGESLTRRSIVCAAGDLNGDRKLDLIIGDQDGVLSIVSNFRDASDISEARADLVFNSKLGQYTNRDLGGKVWPTIVNIFKTDKPSIIVGNELGGMQVLRNDNGESLADEPIIDIFPNPASSSSGEKIYIRTDRPAALLVYSIVGQEIGDPVFLQAFQEYEFGTPANHKGIFIFRFVINGKSYPRRVVIR